MELGLKMHYISLPLSSLLQFFSSTDMYNEHIIFLYALSYKSINKKYIVEGTQFFFYGLTSHRSHG